MAMGIIGSYLLGTSLSYLTVRSDNEFVCQHIYTDDESDISFREVTNKTDGAMRRKLIFAYADKIRTLRAQKEREA